MLLLFIANILSKLFFACFHVVKQALKHKPFIINNKKIILA